MRNLAEYPITSDESLRALATARNCVESRLADTIGSVDVLAIDEIGIFLCAYESLFEDFLRERAKQVRQPITRESEDGSVTAP